MALSIEEQVKKIQNSSLNKEISNGDETLSHHTITEKVKAIRWATQYRGFDEATLELVDSIETYLETYGRISKKQHETLDNIIRNNGIEV